MSENVIFCYSGSGNCLSMAMEIARNLGDTDIIMMRKTPVIKDVTGCKRVGFVVPCYGGGLPAGVEESIKSIRISHNSYRFGIIQYAGYMGCGLHKIDKIVGLDYWSGLSNHCSAIWLMPHSLTFPRTTAEEAQQRSDDAARKIAEDVKAYVNSEKKPPKRLICSVESAGFMSSNKKINAAMNVNDACVSCGTCVRLCPRNNIHIENSKAVIGTDCIGCMACVEYCPQEAINVGSITKKRERYHNSRISAEDLMKERFHFD